MFAENGELLFWKSFSKISTLTKHQQHVSNRVIADCDNVTRGTSDAIFQNSTHCNFPSWWRALKSDRRQVGQIVHVYVVFVFRSTLVFPTMTSPNQLALYFPARHNLCFKIKWAFHRQKKKKRSIVLVNDTRCTRPGSAIWTIGSNAVCSNCLFCVCVRRQSQQCVSSN